MPSIGSSTHVRPVADQPSAAPLSPRSSAAHLAHACTHAHARTCMCMHTHTYGMHIAHGVHMACTWAQFQVVRCARFRLRAHPHAFEKLRVDAVRSAAARVARGRGDHSSARRGVRGEQVRRRLLRNEAVLLAQRLRVMGSGRVLQEG